MKTRALHACMHDMRMHAGKTQTMHRPCKCLLCRQPSPTTSHPVMTGGAHTHPPGALLLSTPHVGQTLGLEEEGSPAWGEGRHAQGAVSSRCGLWRRAGTEHRRTATRPACHSCRPRRRRRPPSSPPTCARGTTAPLRLLLGALLTGAGSCRTAGPAARGADAAANAARGGWHDARRLIVWCGGRTRWVCVCGGQACMRSICGGAKDTRRARCPLPHPVAPRQAMHRLHAAPPASHPHYYCLPSARSRF